MRKTRGITIPIILSPRRGVYNSQALRVSPTQQGLFHGKWLTQRNANESKTPLFTGIVMSKRPTLVRNAWVPTRLTSRLSNNRVVLGESYGIFVDQILGYQVLSRKYPFLFGKTVIL